MFGSTLSKHIAFCALALIGIAALWGCPDPEGRFDEFVERSPKEAGGTGGEGPSQVADLTGKFLLAASVTLNPGAPLLFEATVEMTPGCPVGSCVISFDIQPLANRGSPAAGCPAHLTPIGPVITLKDVPVQPDGTFVANFSRAAVGTVNGCANPISGSDIEATLELVASTRSKDLFCGPLRGSLFRPFTFNLEGSTFGAVRIPDDETPATAGVEPVLRCPAGGGEGGAGGEGGEGAGGTGGQGGDGAGGTGGAGGA